jgi:hypothetical protein
MRPCRWTAEHEAARWQHALGMLARQNAEHHAERDQQARVVADADAHLADVRAEVAAPLIELVTADGAAYLTAQQQMWHVHRALGATGRFGRRPGARMAREATELHRAMEGAMHRRWGGVAAACHPRPWALSRVGRRLACGRCGERRLRAPPR